MAERSAAQKAATRRMIAANRRGRRGGGSRRGGGGGRMGRRAVHRKYTSLTDTAGFASIGYGLLGAPASDGSNTYTLAKSNGISAAGSRLAASVQSGGTFSSNSYYQPARSAVLGGAAIIGLGRLAQHVMSAPHIKVGKFRIRLWGKSTSR